MPALDRPAPSTRSVGRTAPPTAAVHRHNGSRPFIQVADPQLHAKALPLKRTTPPKGSLES